VTALPQEDEMFNIHDDHDKTYLIGNYLIEVWEGQHPTEHAHIWKWRIKLIESGNLVADGMSEDQYMALDAALTNLTYLTLRGTKEERETLIALFPGLRAYRYGASGG
jgi:hypothetical protein